MKFLNKNLRASEKELKSLKGSFVELYNNINSKYQKILEEKKNLNSYKNSLLQEFENKSLKLEEELTLEKANLLSRREKQEAEFRKKLELIEERTSELKGVYNNVFSSVNWLKNKYEDFYFLLDEKSIVYPKGRYATKCSEAQKEFARENKVLRRKVLDLEQQLNQIESLIPDVEEIVDITSEDKYLDDVEVDTTDKIDLLVKQTEQIQLSRTEILQIALDRYVNRKMSKSAVGQDYERFIGYLYEQQGYKVQYHGIKKGLADLGIDLICTKGKETLLIQCKNWSKSKNIHENAINQLFGTSMKFYLDRWEVNKYKSKGSLFEDIGIPFNEDFQPVFITTTELSATALEFAEALRIQILTIPYEKNYPRIKCNVGKDQFGKITRIYHLPFDQKYDITQNILNGGENVLTIGEAEEKGYRKAFRWRGE